MLESGIDRIISQVVDPKINHTFRPQVEKAVHEFLATLNHREEAGSSAAPEEEKAEAVAGPQGALRPPTPPARPYLTPEHQVWSAGLRRAHPHGMHQLSRNPHVCETPPSPPHGPCLLVTDTERGLPGGLGQTRGRADSSRECVGPCPRVRDPCFRRRDGRGQGGLRHPGWLRGEPGLRRPF